MGKKLAKVGEVIKHMRGKFRSTPLHWSANRDMHLQEEKPGRSLPKVVSGDRVTFCFFIWVLVTQVRSADEMAGAGRIACATDSEKYWSKNKKSMPPVFILVKFPKC